MIVAGLIIGRLLRDSFGRNDFWETVKVETVANLHLFYLNQERCAPISPELSMLHPLVTPRNCACAAASRAIGTLNGEQLT
jgi:hypothetical protein